MSTYGYTPLDLETGEIRLVRLHPGKIDDLVTISIFSAFLSAPRRGPTWPKSQPGDLKDLPEGWSAWENLEGHQVYYNAKEQRSTWDFPSETTEREQRKALRHLRYPDKPRTLWVDAISINQDDLLERSQQVNRMGSIYTYAQRVVVWLGSSSHDSTLAIRTLEYLGQQVEYTRNHLWLPAPNCREPNWWRADKSTPFVYDLETWQAIASLLTRSWFARLWVLQEIQLGNSRSYLQCGQDTILWTHIRRAILAIRSHVPAVHAQLQGALQRLYHLCVDYHGQNSIVLLEYARNSECSEPRDKVFALLGLFPYAFSRNIKPQYTLPVQEVYKQAFFAYVEGTSSLDPFLYAGNRSSPSWLPDWSARTGVHGLPSASVASGHSAAQVTPVGKNTLEVTGVLHDTIEDVLTDLPQDHSRFIATAARFFGVDAQPNSIYQTGTSNLEAFAWVLTCGELQEQWDDADIHPSMAETLRIIASSQDASQETSRDIGPFWKNQLLRIRDKTFFKTRNGFFGVGKGTSQPNDKVCVLLGCPLPVILRETSPNEHQLVGCAYVHGIMDAETLLGPLPRDFKVVRQLPWNAARSDVVHRTFINIHTKDVTTQDPRLGPLPEQWVEVSVTAEMWPFKVLQAFENRVTGEVVNSDPRMGVEELRGRGVVLEKFVVV
ncbi:hypothetical protein IQ07DRAFT_580167 [Pyrenochaeta sp. DS3sAY3a]|nr:hypothetical protein IQ07DRAFT_580167 [Pyrenochaeta sp. DS3sAY3a]